MYYTITNLNFKFCSYKRNNINSKEDYMKCPCCKKDCSEVKVHLYCYLCLGIMSRSLSQHKCPRSECNGSLQLFEKIDYLSPLDALLVLKCFACNREFPYQRKQVKADKGKAKKAQAKAK